MIFTACYTFLLFNLFFNLQIKITAALPPNNETIQFIMNNELLNVSFCIIDKGSKPNLPKDLINNILPKTPEIVLPITPNECFLKIEPVMLAPVIPKRILNKEIKVPVIIVLLY